MRNTLSVLDSHLSYIDTGSGDQTVVFLHGNPTSSHIWRNVIPHVTDRARVLAPDLIGMGASGKPDIAYRFADHAAYLDAWFEALDLRDVVLVGHDWGGSLAMDWAARHPDRVRSVVVMETFLRPMTWTEFPPAAVDLFKTLRTPGAGEQMGLEENWFIDVALRATNPGISDEDLAVYRTPYPDPASRLPLLQFPREIPLDDGPSDVRDRMLAYDKWLASTPDVPKLLLVTEGGGLVSTKIEQWARDNVAALEVENIGKAGHHVPEDVPDVIGEAVAKWLTRLTR